MLRRFNRSVTWKRCASECRACETEKTYMSSGEHAKRMKEGRNEVKREGEVARDQRADSSLLAGRLGAGQAVLQKFDLAVVIGFVFGDMKPFRVIVGAKVAVLFNGR